MRQQAAELQPAVRASAGLSTTWTLAWPTAYNLQMGQQTFALSASMLSMARAQGYQTALAAEAAAPPPPARRMPHSFAESGSAAEALEAAAPCRSAAEDCQTAAVRHDPQHSLRVHACTCSAAPSWQSGAMLQAHLCQDHPRPGEACARVAGTQPLPRLKRMLGSPCCAAGQQTSLNLHVSSSASLVAHQKCRAPRSESCLGFQQTTGWGPTSRQHAAGDGSHSPAARARSAPGRIWTDPVRPWHVCHAMPAVCIAASAELKLLKTGQLAASLQLLAHHTAEKTAGKRPLSGDACREPSR